MLPFPPTLPAFPARPAGVVTTPAGVTARMVCPEVSATHRLPLTSEAIP